MQLASGVFAPFDVREVPRLQRIHVNRAVTNGTQCATIAGAAEIHRICTPPRLPPAQFELPRRRDLDQLPLLHVDGILVPSRVRTAVELARWQPLPSALIPLECLFRNGVTQAEVAALPECVASTRGWPGTAQLKLALHHLSTRSGSALESYSRGLMIDGGLPLPQQQVKFVIDGSRYYVDFYWPQLRLVGEADGEMKFDEHGRAQYAQHRRQAQLQSLGLTVVRWGWPDIYPNAERWLAGMAKILHV